MGLFAVDGDGILARTGWQPDGEPWRDRTDPGTRPWRPAVVAAARPRQSRSGTGLPTASMARRTGTFRSTAKPITKNTSSEMIAER